MYIGRTETRWHEELAVPTADLPHFIIAFKKAVEPLTTHSLQGIADYVAWRADNSR